MTTALNNNLNASVAASVQRTETAPFARIPEAEPAPSGGRLPQWTGDVSPRSSKRPAVRWPKTTAKIPFTLLPTLPNERLRITLLPLPVPHAQGEAVPRRRISANERTYRAASLSTVNPTITLDFGPSTSKVAIRFDPSSKTGHTTGSAADPALKLWALQHEVHWSTRSHATAR